MTQVNSLSIFQKLSNIPAQILLFAMLHLPFLISSRVTRVREHLSVHERLYRICKRIRILHLLPKLESTLFQDPNTYEGKLATALVNTSGDLFIDVGANIGRYTVLLARNYRHVIAIEPMPRIMPFLRANVEQTGLTNVQFLQCAVSNADGYADLHISSSSETHSLQTDPRGQRLPGTETWVGRMTGSKIRVKTQTLASILQNRGADLVKVDVEGAEWLVLEGAEPAIEKIKSWVVELHSWWDEAKREKLEQWFNTRGYICSWLDINHIYAIRKND